MEAIETVSVFLCLLLVFSVNCMHQGSESYAISIICMYVLYMWQNWQLSRLWLNFDVQNHTQHIFNLARIVGP